MRPLRILIALALAFSLAGSARAAITSGNGGKTAKHMVHGTVVSVQKNGANASTITVRVHHHGKKGGTASASVNKTFQVSANTKFESVAGKKGAVQKTPADLSSVQNGSHVLIFHSGNNATDVKIVSKGNKKKA